jgi:hypothetical protein
MAAATDPGEIAVAASNYIGSFDGRGKRIVRSVLFVAVMAPGGEPSALPQHKGARDTIPWERDMPGISPYERQLIDAALSSRGNDMDAGTALVMLPDLPDFRRIGDGAIWPALQAAGFRPLRSDPAFHSGSWVGDVARWLRFAELIVADLTARNPDVLMRWAWLMGWAAVRF